VYCLFVYKYDFKKSTILSLKLNINKLRAYYLPPAREKLHHLNFSDGCINTHNNLQRSEKQQKKFLTNCVKTKGLKKKYLYFLLEAYLSQNNNILKKFLSLSLKKKYNFQLLKKVYSSLRCIAYYWVNNSTSKKKTKTTYTKILRKSYLSLISIKLFLLRENI